MRPVDVVIPVYEGYDEVRRCLESVLHTVDPAWARVVVINDGSPNAEIAQYLRTVDRASGLVTLLENDENLGFVATANRGLAHDADRDVLLLNSDVAVAGDWLHRLREAAYRHELVASITPFSNNATICSFPNFCEDNRPWLDLPVEIVDACFADLFTADDVVEVPTGVGFCMYIRRDCLEDVGLFDLETFGRGYGEENDWCQRAGQRGWRNYQLANCFVYHKGKVSFGREHSPRVERALQLLDQRYPGYHGEVQEFIALDPFKHKRVKALLTLFAQQEKPKILFISHKMGGGAQQHVDELASCHGEDVLFLQLTPHVDGQSVTLAVFDDGHRLKDGLYFDVERDLGKLVRLLGALGVSRVHFHHTLGLHPRLWLLARELGCGCDLTVHDYFLLNGNPTLTDGEARYVPEDTPHFDRRCAEHYPLPEGIDGEQWRANQKLLVEGADRVIFPSLDCSRRFRKFFNVRHPVIAWHPDYQLSQPYPAPVWKHSPGRPLKVLVIGAISREKGADVLEEVAGQIDRRNVEFHLLGYAYRALSGKVITHGPYNNARVYSLVEAIEPDLVWYPALWPETYSYTLSIALHMGLPVVVPNIGAFVERVKGRSHSAICPWDRTVGDWRHFWEGVARHGRLEDQDFSDPVNSGESCEVDFYHTAYMDVVPAQVGQLDGDILDGLLDNLYTGRPELSGRERMLETIWNLSRRPLASKIVSLVPFRVQRAIKRRFSSRPMHEIVSGK